MKGLVDYINECCVGACYKISYQPKEDKDGNVYRQTINVSMSEDELNEFNNRMKDMARSRVRYDGIYKELEEGENFTTHGTCSEFCDFFNIAQDKRLRNENTVIIVKINK